MRASFALPIAIFLLGCSRDEALPGHAGTIPAPDLAFVLRQERTLRLAPEQSRRLKRLADQFSAETAEARAALDQATAEFARQMREQGGKPMPLSELQQQAAAVSELSRQFAAARRRCWDEAAKAPTPRQRAQAEALWVKQLSVGSRAISARPAGRGGMP